MQISSYDMDAYEKDEVPMLLETREQPLHDGRDSQRQRRTFLTQSASWSLRMDSFPSYERNNIGGFTGPLRSPKQSSFVQMSGPLSSSTAQDLYPVQGKTGGNMKEIPRENPPAYNGTNENIWPRDNYGERNDNLLKSGQLGMCNDPYCTICPSDYRYKGAGLKPKRTNDKFDFKWDSYLYGDSKGWARTFCSFMYSCLPGIINPHNKYVQLWNQFFVISSLVSIFIDPLFFFVLSIRMILA